MPYLRQENKKIGFVWLCFFEPRSAVYCHNIFKNKTLRQFTLPVNWVCFFKTYPFKSSRISCLVLRISSQRPANWLCFSNWVILDTDLHRSTLLFEPPRAARLQRTSTLDIGHSILDIQWTVLFILNSPFYIHFVKYSTNGNRKKRTYFQKISMTRRPLCRLKIKM